MPWIEVTTAMVERRLAGTELEALRTAALGDDQDDPLPGIIAEVVEEIRGYVAACSSNTLSSGATIPQKLQSAALALIRGRMITRLPGSGLLDEDRRSEIRSAETLLRDVAACRFSVDAPDDPVTDEVSRPGGAETVTSTTPKMTRQKMDGLL